MLLLLGGQCHDAHAETGETLVDLLGFLELLAGELDFGELLAPGQVDEVEFGLLGGS